MFVVPLLFSTLTCSKSDNYNCPIVLAMYICYSGFQDGVVVSHHLLAYYSNVNFVLLWFDFPNCNFFSANSAFLQTAFLANGARFGT